MLKRISLEELMDWQAYDMVEPFGSIRDDYQAASICSTVMNAMFIQNRSSRRMKTRDFLLEFREAGPEDLREVKREQEPDGGDWRRLKFIAQMHVAAANAEKTRKTRGRKRK